MVNGRCMGVHVQRGRLFEKEMWGPLFDERPIAGAPKVLDFNREVSSNHSSLLRTLALLTRRELFTFKKLLENLHYC